MAGFLQEGMEPELAVPCRVRYNGSPHHQVFPQPHRGRCKELPLCSEAQEEVNFKGCIDVQLCS